MRVPWEICDRTMVGCQLKKKKTVKFLAKHSSTINISSRKNSSIELVELEVVGFKFSCKVEFYV